MVKYGQYVHFQTLRAVSFQMMYSMMHLRKKPNLAIFDHSADHMSGQMCPIVIFLKSTRHKLSNDI